MGLNNGLLRQLKAKQHGIITFMLLGGLVQLPGSSGGSPTGIVKCWHCCNNFDRPKVLHGCFHTFCEPCLEKIQDHPEKITCPQCNTETMLGNPGISGLLSDYGIFGMER